MTTSSPTATPPSSLNAANSHEGMAALFNSATAVSDELLQRYATSGPRYTSYPTVPNWSEAVDAATYEAALARNSAPETPLALYIHLPFCAERCLFCGCNVVITKQVDQAEKYLGYLFQEIERVADLVDTRRPVEQLHWGGGTPTYLNCEQIERLTVKLKQHFTFAEEAELAIEVDPRVTTHEQLQVLRQLGFNRVSMGVQDFDPLVQQTIHRIQPEDMTARLVHSAQDLGFGGINLDLIYGLPHQQVETFERSVEAILRLQPDRLALYNYAHVPWMSPHQKQLPEEALPSGKQKFAIFRMAITRLLEAGYRYIGMDHFAKPEDELNQALEAGTLHRNFMGYTTRAGQAELLGMGVSAISSLSGHYAQNEKKLSTYYQALEAGKLPTQRGYVLNEDDQQRRWVIQALLCQGALNYTAVAERFGLDAPRHYAQAIEALKPMQADGLLSLSEEGIQLHPLGRLLARNIAMAFDAYLGQQRSQFSKTV